MSVETVRAFLAAQAPDIGIVELDASTATVEMAARGHGVAPAQIAKTLSLRIKERTLPVCCDVSLKQFDEVVPAAGTTNSALRINPARLASLVGAQWVGVCDRG